MITEKDISVEIGREVKSPIRVGTLEELGVQSKEFLNYYQKQFDGLQDDLYLVKEKQIEFLIGYFNEDKRELETLYQPYFEGKIELSRFEKWIAQLPHDDHSRFSRISIVTRKRSIATFNVRLENEKTQVKRLRQKDYQQDVDDFRSWKRVFAEASHECVEAPLFKSLLEKTCRMTKQIHPKVTEFHVTSHFMRTLAYLDTPGENAPEGVHEDGAQYIMSALVVNRMNITGGESQIIEKLPDGTMEHLYDRVLKPGEFVFQADTGEERTFGNDLWHYVTPIEVKDPKKVGVRDIIGFDIELN